jgi:hypothetical protein
MLKVIIDQIISKLKKKVVLDKAKVKAQDNMSKNDIPVITAPRNPFINQARPNITAINNAQDGGLKSWANSVSNAHQAAAAPILSSSDPNTKQKITNLFKRRKRKFKQGGSQGLDRGAS